MFSTCNHKLSLLLYRQQSIDWCSITHLKGLALSYDSNQFFTRHAVICMFLLRPKIPCSLQKKISVILKGFLVWDNVIQISWSYLWFQTFCSHSYGNEGMLIFLKSRANFCIILLTLYALSDSISLVQYLETDYMQTQHYFSFLFKRKSPPSVLHSQRISLSHSFFSQSAISQGSREPLLYPY